MDNAEARLAKFKGKKVKTKAKAKRAKGCKLQSFLLFVKMEKENSLHRSSSMVELRATSGRFLNIA